MLRAYFIERCRNDRCSPEPTITAPYPYYEENSGSAIEAIRNRERYIKQSALTRQGDVPELPP